MDLVVRRHRTKQRLAMLTASISSDLTPISSSRSSDLLVGADSEADDEESMASTQRSMMRNPLNGSAWKADPVSQREVTLWEDDDDSHDGDDARTCCTDKLFAVTALG